MQWVIRIYVLFVVVLALALVGGVYYTSVNAQKVDAQKAAPAEKPVKVETCYGCHAPIKEFHATGKHKDVNCVFCHTGLDKHVANVKDRPDTRTDHKAAYVIDSAANHLKGKARKAEFRLTRLIMPSLLISWTEQKTMCKIMEDGGKHEKDSINGVDVINCSWSYCFYRIW